MRKKSESTILQRAMQTVEGFDKVYHKMRQQSILGGRSESTFENYLRRIALVCLEFNQLPEDISEDEINEYLTALAQSSKSPSRSSFKHAVYGLRLLFSAHRAKQTGHCPAFDEKKKPKLPVIFNRSELRQLFRAPTLLKHRIVFGLDLFGRIAFPGSHKPKNIGHRL